MRPSLLCAFVLVACAGPGNNGGTGGGDPGTGGGMDMSNHTVDRDTLPCDVAAVLEDHCTSCHGSVPTGGALTSLLNRADLTAPMPDDMVLTVGEASSFRMQSMGADIMPPPGSPAAQAVEIQLFAAWVGAGMLPTSCNNNAPAPTTCPSNSMWQLGDTGSDLMHPGLACIQCHTSRVPREKFTFAGTVFTDQHTKDNCNAGPNSSGRIELIGADGKVTTLSANEAGNFFTFATIAMPYTARVDLNGRVRSMLTPQTVGDCNTCHSEQGSVGAPGRIFWPN
jgi:hypothetical protein